MSDPVRYRTGAKQPHNIYMVTAEHPEGIPIGHACKPDPERAAEIVDALNLAVRLNSDREADPIRCAVLTITEAAADCHHCGVCGQVGPPKTVPWRCPRRCDADFDIQPEESNG